MGPWGNTGPPGLKGGESWGRGGTGWFQHGQESLVRSMAGAFGMAFWWEVRHGSLGVRRKPVPLFKHGVPS